jgi:hypothetical protein
MLAADVKEMWFSYLSMFHIFLIRIVGGDVQIWSTRNVGHFCPIAPAPGDCEDGEFGGIKIGRGNRSTRRKPAPAPLCPPQFPLDQRRARTWAAAVWNQRLTAWDMARPWFTLTVFARLNAVIVGSNPIQGMDICMRLFCVCVVLLVGTGLATGLIPRQRSSTDCV